jgi:hypothetical protein
MKLTFLWLLAFVGAADCVLIPSLFAASNQQPFFPLPGLYFFEIALLGLLVLASAVRDRSQTSFWMDFLPWIAAGILLAFNILGAWTIGFFLFPGTISFLGVGFLLAGKESRKIVEGLGLFLVASVAQSVLMLALINLV